MPPPAGRLLRPDSTRKDLGVAACAWGEDCGAGLQPKCAVAEANQGHLKHSKRCRGHRLMRPTRGCFR